MCLFLKCSAGEIPKYVNLRSESVPKLKEVVHVQSALFYTTLGLRNTLTRQHSLKR